MGLKSIMEEFGIECDLIVEIDATAAEGMMQRRGLGKMRHLRVQELWTQEAVAMKRFRVRKIKTEDNNADMGTKPLGREQLEKILQRMGFEAPSCR